MRRSLSLLALIGVVALGAVACDAGDPDGAQAPETAEPPDEPTTQEPTATPEPTEPDETPTEEGTADDAEVADYVADVAEQVAELRGLEVREEIDTSVVDQDELVDIAIDDERDDEDEQARQDREDLLVALRLLPPDTDLDEVAEQLVEGGVAGLYDPEEARAYISSEEWPLEPAAQVTTAHEVVHALQDQSFDLTRLSDFDEESPDLAMAFRAIVEGDAVITQEQWASAHLSEAEQEERAQQEQIAGAEAQQALADLPPYVVFEQLIPYELGERFLRAVVEEEGDDGIDARLEEPPATTVELYDPSLHFDGFEAEPVDAPGPPGDDWEPLDAFDFGAYLVNAYYFLAGNLADGSQATAAWRGGQLQAWRGPDGVAVGITVRFTGDAAAGFCGVAPTLHTAEDSVEEVADGRFQTDQDALAVECDAEEVRFATAPTLESAEQMVAP